MQGQIPQRCVDKESAMIKRSREILALLEKNVYKWSFFSILNCFCSGKRFFSTKMIAKRNLVSSQSEFVYERVFFNGNEKKMWKNVWNGIKAEKKTFQMKYFELALKYISLGWKTVDDWYYKEANKVLDDAFVFKPEYKDEKKLKKRTNKKKTKKINKKKTKSIGRVSESYIHILNFIFELHFIKLFFSSKYECYSRSFFYALLFGYAITNTVWSNKKSFPRSVFCQQIRTYSASKRCLSKEWPFVAIVH